MNAMRLYLDIESRSLQDIGVGSYRYAEDPSTIPLCIGWAVDDDPIRLWWYTQPLPIEWRSPGVTFVAHNVQFDRVFFDRHIFQTSVEDWDDTMIRCLYHGLPASLENVSAFLFGAHKDPRGDELVKSTSGKGVCRLQRKKDRRTKEITEWWNENENDMRDLGEYCRQDVHLLRMIDKAVPPLPPDEGAAAIMFERMNDTGVPIDYEFVSAAAAIMRGEMENAATELARITDGQIDSPGQTARIVKYATDRGVTMLNCTADTVDTVLATPGLPHDVAAVVGVRQLSNSAAVHKYRKVLQRLCNDGRIHGEMINYGAHTGRSSSRGVQLQNGKRGEESSYMLWRAAALTRAPGLLTGWVDWNTHLSEAVRSAVAAPDGYSLVVYDYSGVETRGVDYLVGDGEGLELARRGVDRYKILAGSIFRCRPEDVNKHQRSTGKEARLSGQYGVGWKTYRKRLEKTWNVSITEQEAKKAIATFRQSQHLIPIAWKKLENAWRSACAGTPVETCYNRFEVIDNWMTITAPNGRSLYFYNPSGGNNPSYAVPGKSKNVKRVALDLATGRFCEETEKQMLRKHVYGGLILENICQWWTGMIARDDMVAAEKRFDADRISAAWLFMVHDESIALVRNDHIEAAKKIIVEEMTRPAWWCPGLPLDVEGWVGKFYKKG